MTNAKMCNHLFGVLFIHLQTSVKYVPRHCVRAKVKNRFKGMTLVFSDFLRKHFYFSVLTSEEK